jgi:transcriptional regulator with XRE-family HTH domain
VRILHERRVIQRWHPLRKRVVHPETCKGWSLCPYAAGYTHHESGIDTTSTRRICHLEAGQPLARLNSNVEINLPPPVHHMTFQTNPAPLRTLRIRSGLSQREVAEILGFKTDVPAFRHECSRTFPDLRTAMGYEVVFRVPISSQFQALYRSVEPIIENRIVELKHRLEDQSGSGGNAARNAAKLEFLWLRQNTDCD